MHRARRVGGHVLHVHGLPLADGASPKRITLLQHHAQDARPKCTGECQVDESGAGDLDLLNVRIGGDERHDALGQRGRGKLRGLGQHHGGVGRQIPMGWVLGRLKRDALYARILRHDAVMLELLDGRQNVAVKPCENVHGGSGKSCGATIANPGWRQTDAGVRPAHSGPSYRR